MSKRAPFWLIFDDTQICEDNYAEEMWFQDNGLTLPSCFDFSGSNTSSWDFLHDPTFFEDGIDGEAASPMAKSNRTLATGAGSEALTLASGASFGTAARYVGAGTEDMKFRFFFEGEAATISLMSVLDVDGEAFSEAGVVPDTIAISVDEGPLAYHSFTSTSTVLQLPLQNLASSRHVVDVSMSSSSGLRTIGIDHALVKPGNSFAQTAGDADRVPLRAFVGPRDLNLRYSGLWMDVTDSNGIERKETSEIGASVQLSFYGNSTWLLGWAPPGDGEFSIAYEMDGRQSATRHYNSSPQSRRRLSTLIHEAQYTEDGVHNFTTQLIRLEGANPFSITGILYNYGDIGALSQLPDLPLPHEVPPGSPSSPPTDPSSSDEASSSSGSGLRSGAIAGIVVGSIALLVVILALLLWLRRRKQKAQTPVPFEKTYQDSYPRPPVRDDTHDVTDNATDLTYNLTSDGIQSTTSDESVAAGSPSDTHSPLMNVLMNVLNTHYESLNRPPAYPASELPSSSSDPQSRRYPN
ncbi:hypothetical protein BDV98DRAFT_658930 [Pterulicium gracile]|uniref:Transmembrane protein n=1 Tax=Pterulicium gracile TaxID=1884261 RepID=A0A5C3Q4R5_9AGAR|nr:hypothetical protein BDV98DRAFT_658930 [Pterula gracilis]